jgi:hypothetical protein
MGCEWIRKRYTKKGWSRVVENDAVVKKKKTDAARGKNEM